MATKAKRKPNTAMVFNPRRRLSLGGSRQANPVRKRRSNRRRRNPVTKAITRRRNPVRRRSNPITSATQLVIAAVMTALGVSLFDVGMQRLVPQQSAIVRIGVKGGVAWLVNSYGQKIPVLGKYRSEIALVILTSAVIDGLKLWVFPLVANTAAQFGLVAPQGQLVGVPDGDDTTGNIWGNSNVYKFA